MLVIVRRKCAEEKKDELNIRNSLTVKKLKSAPFSELVVSDLILQGRT